jgi:hypothetical protein
MSLCDTLLATPWLRWLARALNCKEPAPAPLPPANVQWIIANDRVTLVCDKRSATAVRSIMVRGYEYLASPDRGAQLQTAMQIDGGGEQNNPTEAGSVPDGNGPTSSSRILSVSAVGKVISASSQMCYWYPIGGQPLSDQVLDKRIELGWNGMWNVIRDDRTIHNPSDRSTVMFECLTGYMVLDMNLPYEFDSNTGQLTLIPYTPSEFFDPSKIVNTEKDLIVARANGSQAIGIRRPNTGYGLGFWGGAGNYSNKWVGGKPVTPYSRGDYSWTFFLAVGTLEEVKHSLQALAQVPLS